LHAGTNPFTFLAFEEAGRRVSENGGASSGKGGGERRTLYCVIPADLAQKLHDLLRRHWRDDPSITVIVERRGSERRGPDRRDAAEALGPERDANRRTIRNARGRRVADRRALSVQMECPALPRRARAHADRLLFVERFEPSEQALLDIDSDRLVISAQQGDPSAMGELYLRYFDRVYGYTRMALRDPHEAEDVAQQVFANVMQAISRYEVRPGAPFRAWLFRVARNALLDVVRERKRMFVQDPEQIHFKRDAEAREEAETMLTWLSDVDLSFFVERLPAAQREVLVLRYMLDMGTNEIAAVVARTPKAVSRLQERAIKTLEQRLVAIGRKPLRRQRTPMWVRLKPAPVASARRFALASMIRPAAVTGERGFGGRRSSQG
jgi:RNA polymerase sigma-70 factor (ECF subfamily)